MQGIGRSLCNAASRARARRACCSRPGAVEALVDYLDEPSIRKLIFEAQTMRNPTWRDDTLAVLVPRLADLGHAEEAQGLAGHFTSGANVAAALTKMVPKLAEPQRATALRTALDAVRDVDDES